MNPAAAPPENVKNAWKDLFDFLEPLGVGQEGTSARGVESREDRAFSKYEEVFCKLTAFFDSRGCADAEDRAEETILRVAKNCSGVTLDPDARPLSYFYGVARNVLHEVYKEQGRESKMLREQQLMPKPDPPPVKEARDECLQECMEKKLEADERDLILDYYRGERGVKIERRRKLATALGKDLNALRIMTYRIRKRLRPCIADCMQRKSVALAFA